MVKFQQDIAPFAISLKEAHEFDKETAINYKISKMIELSKIQEARLLNMNVITRVLGKDLVISDFESFFEIPYDFRDLRSCERR